MFFLLADALWLSGNVSERYSSLVYFHPPYHESASEENRGERGYGTLTFKDLAVTRNITSGLFNDG